MNEIFLPILEMRTASLRQKSVLLSMLYRLGQDPQALVEIYLNYDCDREAKDNIYERSASLLLISPVYTDWWLYRLMNIVSKMGTTHLAPQAKTADPNASHKDANGNPQKGPPQVGPTFPPSANTTVLGGIHAVDSVAGAMPGFTESKQKRQSLECLVAVLRSLVVWGTGSVATTGIPIIPPSNSNSSSINGTRSGTDRSGPSRESGLGSAEDLALDEGISRPDSFINGSGMRVNGGGGGGGTPDIGDDPGTFETAKQRKTTLLEGIRKFNFKPKRVSYPFPLHCLLGLKRELLLTSWDGLNRGLNF